MSVINTIGRRKTTVSRIYMSSGKGNITVNGRKFEDYFTTDVLRMIITEPLRIVGEEKGFDVKVNVSGGGVTGQAEATRMAISRALCEANPEHRLLLKPEGFLTRDSRMVERKKYGRRKARRQFQFSKR